MPANGALDSDLRQVIGLVQPILHRLLNPDHQRCSQLSKARLRHPVASIVRSQDPITSLDRLNKALNQLLPWLGMPSFSISLFMGISSFSYISISINLSKKYGREGQFALRYVLWKEC